MTDLVYDETYYFTVFVFHEHYIATHHANATYKFQKSKPIGLKDARPRMINLRAQNGKASFRYKVGGLFTCCGKHVLFICANYYGYVFRWEIRGSWKKMAHPTHYIGTSCHAMEWYSLKSVVEKRY